jgi:hypothetical protein
MKGTDVSAEEIRSVREFLEASNGEYGPWDEANDAQPISSQRGQFIRMIAWYGALRSRGAPLPGRPPMGWFEVVDQPEAAARPEPRETAGQYPR